MLLQGDGVQGAQNTIFIDSSVNALAITRTGTPTQGSFSPFSQTGWSGNFVAGSSLLVPISSSLDLVAGDFTIEFWMNAPTSASSVVVGNYSRNPQNVSAVSWMVYINSGNLVIELCSGGTQTFFTIGTIAVTFNNNWNHVAITRSSNTVKTFLNGVLVTSTAYTSSLNSGFTTLISGLAGTYEYQYLGSLSNVRIVKGSAVYTSNFTPSTVPLAAIAGTSLLTLQDNRFKDNSVNNFTITAVGTPSIQALSPFAPSIPYSPSAVGGSGYLNGTTDYLSFPANANINLTTGDFTIELWAYQSSATLKILLTDKTQIGAHLEFAINANSTVYFYNGTASYSTSNLAIPGQWNHIAVSMASGVLKIFINGVQGFSGAVSVGFTNPGPWLVGRYAGGTQYNFNGYMSDLRITKGTALYTATFTPPVSPLTASGAGLMLNFTNGGIIDGTAKNDIMQATPAATISTSTKKFGTGSIAFNGSANGGLVVQPSAQTAFTGDFTVEFWVTLSSLAGTQDFVGNYVSNAGGNWTIQCLARGIQWYPNSASTNIASTTMNLNQWYHVAAVRSGSTCSLYLNGNSQGTLSFSGTLGSSTAPIYVGSRNNTMNGVNGNIDDLRITNGIARYTANFTPPTAALPSQ